MTVGHQNIRSCRLVMRGKHDVGRGGNRQKRRFNLWRGHSCGDLVCHGDVGGRTGICMKGGTIIVGGRTGAFSGFMMQRGRMIILGDAGANLGDSMYDGTIYVGGKIADLGVDAVEGEMTELDTRWLSANSRNIT